MVRRILFLVVLLTACTDDIPTGPAEAALAKGSTAPVIPAFDLGGHPELVHSRAMDVNASGVAVGYAGRGSGSPDPMHAMRWVVSSTGAVVSEDLHLRFPSAIRSIAMAVNAGGDVVGWVQFDLNTSSTRPYLLRADGTLVILETQCGEQATARQGFAADISDNGDIIGAQGPSGTEPLFWTAGATCADSLPTLGPNTEVAAVAPDGNSVVGYSGAYDSANPAPAVRWIRRSDGTGWDVEPLAAPSWTFARSIDADGNMAGHRVTTTWVTKRGTTYLETTNEAYRWIGGVTLEKLPSLGGSNTRATGIDAGRAVGYSSVKTSGFEHAVLWSGGQAIDLWAGRSQSSIAMSIRGRYIAGSGIIDIPGRYTESHAFVWILP